MFGWIEMRRKWKNFCLLFWMGRNESGKKEIVKSLYK